jgi:hypothetical protein
MRALYEESQLPSAQWKDEVRRGKEFALECVGSIEDKTEVAFNAASCPTGRASTHS